MTTYRLEAVLPLVAMLVVVGCGTTGDGDAGHGDVGSHATEEGDGHAAQDTGHQVHWGYGADDGPVVWNQLSPEFVLCAEGHAQSPVDLQSDATSPGPPIVLDPREASIHVIRHEHVFGILNNGHTVQVNVDDANTLTTHGNEFDLKQFHFHAPSEHTVDGKHYPMELHLVHQASDGELAVLGVLIREGAHHDAFDDIWGLMPLEPGDEHELDHLTIQVDELLPAGRDIFRYEGSLTTPPCSEGVHWYVFANPIEMDAEQIRTFTAMISGNNRPIQPLNDRQVDRVSYDDDDTG
jgi:carbonic anhydrase